MTTRDEIAAAAQELQVAAEDLAKVGSQRVFEEGGIVEQMTDGSWLTLNEHDAAGLRELAAEATRLAEAVRTFRATAPSITKLERRNAEVLESRLGDALPMNRAEAYFTATVLPGIVAANQFEHLDLLLAICGLHVTLLPPQRQEVQFWTEYSLFKSFFATSEDRARFVDAPKMKDTPDVVIVGDGWLLVIEAKMYHRPSKVAFSAQLEKQAKVVAYWSKKFGIEPSRTQHVVLLPAAFAQGQDWITNPVITWQQILEAYEQVGASYWLEVLRVALARYDELSSKDLVFDGNEEGRLAGEDIVKIQVDEEGSFQFVGRSGGLAGDHFEADIASGSWKKHKYQVSTVSVPNDNWFAVEDFIARVSGPGA